MYSALAFLLTAIEIGAVAAGFALQSQAIVYDTLIYGSPFYLIQHAVGADSLLHEKNPLYLAFAAFHIVKYGIIIQSQRREDRNIMRNLALLFEAGYVGLSAYYLL